MNIKRTREFYKQLSFDDLCSCDYCKNYVRQIKSEYPILAEYLQKLGIDIEKPFEIMLSTDPDENGYVEYMAAQYIVYGECKGFEHANINSVDVDIAECHPSTTVKELHFVIEIYPIRLKWVM